MLSYPARLKKQPEGGYVVKFRDVPEAITQGETREEAIEMAEDALITALSFYMEDNKPLPIPTLGRRGEVHIDLKVENTCRVMFYESMRRKGMTVKDLAVKMGVTPRTAQRLLKVTGKTSLNDLMRVACALDMRVVSQIGEPRR